MSDAKYFWGEKDISKFRQRRKCRKGDGGVETEGHRGMTGRREKQRQMGRWTEGEGPLTAVSKQDGSAQAMERAMMTQKARQLCPFYYWANSFIDRVPLPSLRVSLIPPVQLRTHLLTDCCSALSNFKNVFLGFI